MADIRFFPWRLSNKEVEQVRNGDITGRLTTGATFNISNVTTIDTNITVSRKFSYKELLKPKSKYTVIKFIEEATYLQSFQICTRYGGDLIDGKDKDLIREKCLVNIKHEVRDLWLNYPEFNDSNLSNGSNCKIVNFKQNQLNEMMWPCSLKALLICCVVPRNNFIRLKGDLHLRDNRLIFAQETNMGLTLEGIGKLRVFFNNSKAVIQNDAHSYILRSGTNPGHLIGRKTWFDAYDKEITLTLSPCKIGQFTCDNGQCVNLTKRCNGIPLECDDYSDDDDSCWLFQGPPTHYFKQEPPKDPHVNLSISIVQYRDVNLDKKIVSSVTMLCGAMMYEAGCCMCN